MSEPADLLTEWVRRLSAELDLPEGAEIDIGLVLDLARDAAHGVARPAAPLSTFLVGYSAGLRGGSPQEIQRATQLASLLASEWTQD